MENGGETREEGERENNILSTWHKYKTTGCGETGMNSKVLKS